MIARTLYLLIFYVLTASSVSGQAYVRNRGEIFGAFKYLNYQTDHFWNRSGQKEKSYDHYQRQEGELYLEYGATRRDVIGFKGAYDYVKEELDGNHWGFTEFELSWRRLFRTTSNSTLSGRILAIIPPKAGYKPGLRYGQYGAEADLFFTKRFSVLSRPSFFVGALGYRWYQGFPSDQIRNHLVFDFCLTSKIHFLAKSDLYYGVFNGKSRLDQSNIWMNPNFRLWKAEFSLCYQCQKNSHLTLGYFQHLWGENVGTGGGFIGRAMITF